MTFHLDANWGLKLLALVLAIVIYEALKNEPRFNTTSYNDRQITTPNP